VQTAAFVNYLMPSLSEASPTLSQTTVEEALAPTILAEIKSESEAEAQAALDSHNMVRT